MTWSGDDTTAGGKENVTVNLAQAFSDGKWIGETQISLRAGWYAPAGGSGEAIVTVSLRDKTTGALSGSLQQTIQPGRQSACASTPVGAVYVTSDGQNLAISFPSLSE